MRYSGLHEVSFFCFFIYLENKKDVDAVKFLVTNRIHWSNQKSVEIYRYRWMGTKTFH
jgi:hypothetical protein